MAPLWDFSKGQFVGVLSALDFILILREVCLHLVLCSSPTSEFSKMQICSYYFGYKFYAQNTNVLVLASLSLWLGSVAW